MPDEETAGTGQAEDEATETMTDHDSDEESGVESRSDSAENRIPLERFNEVIGERNDLRRQLEENRAVMAKLQNALLKQSTSEKPQVDKYDADAPPEGMSPQQQIEWHVTKYGKKNAAAILGVDPSELKEAIGLMRESSKEIVRLRAQRDFERHGLDIDDPDQLDICKALVQSGVDYDEALKRMKRMFGKSNGATVTQEKTKKLPNVETGGVTPTMAQKLDFLVDKREAMRLAKAGKRVPHASVEEIFAHRDRLNKRG